MNSYKAKISMRFFGDASHNSSLNDFVQNVLGGHRFSQREQYVSYRLFSGECEPGMLEQELARIGEKLFNNKDFVELGDEGRVELFIGLFVNSNVGIELNSELMRICSRLDLDISFDIYPSEVRGQVCTLNIQATNPPPRGAKGGGGSEERGKGSPIIGSGQTQNTSP